jgi:hypothetical protein
MFIRNLGLGVAAGVVSGKSIARDITNSKYLQMEKFNTHEFPAPDNYALEYIDARTMDSL